MYQITCTFTHNSNIVTGTFSGNTFVNYLPPNLLGTRVWFPSISNANLSSATTYITGINTGTQLTLSSNYTGSTVTTATYIFLYSVSTSSPTITVNNASDILGAGLL